MMKKRVLTVLMGIFLVTAPAFAQQKTITGRVTSDTDAPMAGAQVIVKGTRFGTLTNNDGLYSIRADVGQVLQFRFIGNAPVERTVGADNVINVQLKKVATGLDAVVVSALGQTNVKRAIGTAQQSITGVDIAQTNRQNFINALQGRIAGVEVTSSSGVPGASTSITIRGVSSISSSNQPLMIIDGLPLDNKTLGTAQLAADAPGSQTAFSNRGVDFTNRASDLNPEDIESLVVLKGPEASALYGIDAANGAIVITTKRGKPGTGGFEYSNFFRMDTPAGQPELQKVYSAINTSGSPILGSASYLYYGAPYASGTKLYDNVDGFFRTALTQKHSLAFSGAAPDNRINYRISVSADKQEGVVPNTNYNRINLTGASQAVVNSWLKADLTMTYSYSTNDQVLKGAGGPLIGLLVWPQDDQASNWQTAAGTRRRLTTLSDAAEVDNPYFSVNKNQLQSKTGRIMSNMGLTIAPFSWGNLKTNIGVDNYTNSNLIMRHPESATGYTWGGILDVATDLTRNISTQTLLNINSRQLWQGISISGVLGNAVSDYKSTTEAQNGLGFLDPNFVSINNTTSRTARNTISQRRLLSVFGSATVDYNKYLYVTVTGRNDWTSTIPEERNSFFYPSVSGSFIFSDAFPSIGQYMTGKLRAGYAEVGKDARPYAYRPSLENKTTSYGGYGYGFTGPNLALKPEFAKSYEIGTELAFLDDRLGVDVTWYRKETKDQIVNDIRGSYATGFILFNLNGAVTRNEGTEITLRGTPWMTNDVSWDVMANFDHSFGRVLALPNALPESYNSDTWLYGNVRNGVTAGSSTRSLTGFFYQRNTAGDLLIDPTTGLPLRNSVFVDRGYDRQPDLTVGLSNTLRWKKLTVSALIDIRKGGDILNATDHYLTARGLTPRTLDRNEPRVIKGVLRDGKENSATPTINNIVVVPAVNTNYYVSMSEELFIEKDINWIRLKDVTLRYQLPASWFGARNASFYITGSDLWLETNYTGLDPVVNGNTAALGGSGAAGIDFGNFPMPKGVAFGLKVGF
ncbi:MAG: SusC/RagA family TonB-linked outer membrane protein [Gemmatimonadota bacterium]|nr:SusC/RagA family TonB-linked outer membrane protein [Gemmatimonadota bacterium]